MRHNFALNEKNIDPFFFFVINLLAKMLVNTAHIHKTYTERSTIKPIHTQITHTHLLGKGEFLVKDVDLLLH